MTPHVEDAPGARGSELTVAPVSELPALLVDASGGPVWPYRSAAERACLERAAASFGLTLRPAVEPRPAQPSREGAVVTALGAAALPPALLYAHLSGRRARLISGVEALLDAEVEVVITTADRFDAALIDALTLGDRATSVGLLCATGAEGLWRQVLVRSAALRAERPARARVDVLPEQRFALMERGSWRVYGAEAEDEALREGLSSGADLIHLETHGNGLDAMLSRRLILCAVAGERAPDPGPSTEREREGRPRALACLRAGRCARLDAPIAEVAGRLLDPAELAARVLLFNTCFGVLDTTGTTAPEATLAMRLAANDRLGAILAPWTINVASERSDYLLADLAAGAPLGEALARHNRDPQAVKGGNHMLLFGDPGLRLRGLPARSGPPRRASPEPCAPWAERLPVLGDEPASPELASELTLLSDYLDALSASADPSLRNPPREIERAREAIEGYAELLLAPAREADAGRRGDRFRDALSRLAAANGRIYGSWRGGLRHPLRLGCPRCARAAFCWILEPTIEARPRRLIQCPACAVVEDAPLDTELRLSAQGRRLILRGGPLPREGWTARLSLWHVKFGDGLELEWPRGARGAPAEELILPETGWDAGARTNASLWMFWGTRYLELTAPLDPGPSMSTRR